MASSDTRGLLLGDWGILRAYQGQADDLAATPSNPYMAAPKPARDNIKAFYDSLIAAKKVRQFNVYAVSPIAVKNVDGSVNTDGLVYYNRGKGKLTDPDAVIYVTDEVYDPVANQFRPGFVPEPLVLRANAGDLIQVTLTNKIPLPPGATLGQRAGMHAQLVTYDVTTSDGFNGGNNKNQTAEKPGDTVAYQWYAGNITLDPRGNVTGEPAEFGAVNLTPSDPASSPLNSQISHGLFGALVIEPEGSTWLADADSKAQATVTLADGATRFREFVLMVQDLVPADAPDGFTAIDSQVQAVNYKSELMPLRINFQSGEQFPDYNAIDISDATSDLLFQRHVRPADADLPRPAGDARSVSGLAPRRRVVHAAEHSRPRLEADADQKRDRVARSRRRFAVALARVARRPPTQFPVQPLNRLRPAAAGQFRATTSTGALTVPSFSTAYGAFSGSARKTPTTFPWRART